MCKTLKQTTTTYYNKMCQITQLQMQALYSKLPEDLKQHVEVQRYNEVVQALESEFRSWRHFDLMAELKDHTDDWCAWEDPSNHLINIVNEDRHYFQPGHSDLDKYMDKRQEVWITYEDPDYEFQINCRQCAEDGAFPCQRCSHDVLRGWVIPDCFDFHNFAKWPVDE